MNIEVEMKQVDLSPLAEQIFAAEEFGDASFLVDQFCSSVRELYASRKQREWTSPERWRVSLAKIYYKENNEEPQSCGATSPLTNNVCFESQPKVGDAVRIKYPDGDLIGRVVSVEHPTIGDQLMYEIAALRTTYEVDTLWVSSDDIEALS